VIYFYLTQRTKKCFAFLVPQNSFGIFRALNFSIIKFLKNKIFFLIFHY